MPLASARAFRIIHRAEQSQELVLLPACASLLQDDAVELRISLTQERVVFFVRGRVLWGQDASPEPQPSVGIAIAPEGRAAVARILALVDNAAADRTGLRHQVAIDLTLHHRNGDLICSAATDDLSAGGCFVLTEEPLEVGAELEVELQLPKGVARFCATIVWRQQRARTGLGLQFTKPLADADVVLRRYLA